MASLLESVTDVANTQSENSSASSAQRSRSPVSTQADSSARRTYTPAIAQDESSDTPTPVVDDPNNPQVTEPTPTLRRGLNPAWHVEEQDTSARRSPSPVPEQTIGQASRSRTPVLEQEESVDLPVGQASRSLVPALEQEPIAQPVGQDSFNIWHNNDVLVGEFERDTLTNSTSIDVSITTLDVEPVISANGVLDVYGWSYQTQSGMSAALFNLDFSMGTSTNEIDYSDRSIYPQLNAVSINPDFTTSSVL